MVRLAFAGYVLLDKILQKIRQEEYIITRIYTFGILPCNYVDGVEIADLAEIGRDIADFDYIIIADTVHFEEYFSQIEKYVDYRKILNGERIAAYIGFDLKYFLKLLDSEISIISDSCWGGMLYHSLGMRMNSVLVNTSVEPEDYLEFCSHLDYYLSCSMEKYSERNAWSPPIGILDGKVKIMFNHYLNFQEALENWNKRLKRMNYDNIFVQMSNFSDYEQVVRFNELPIKNKVGFWPIETNLESICYLQQYEDTNIRTLFGEYGAYIQEIIAAAPRVFRPINVFKMLLGEEHFIRMI